MDANLNFIPVDIKSYSCIYYRWEVAPTCKEKQITFAVTAAPPAQRFVP